MDKNIWLKIFTNYLNNKTDKQQCPICNEANLNFTEYIINPKIYIQASCPNCSSHQEIIKINSEAWESGAQVQKPKDK